MRNLIPSLVVALTLAGTASFADDPIVWDNGDVLYDEFNSYWIITVQDGGQDSADNALADDFMLEQHTLITRVQWACDTWNLNLGVDLPEAFIIEFFASNRSGKLPTDGVVDPSETALASYMIPIEDVQWSSDGEWPDPDLEFAADLPLPFEATADTLYWISVQGYFEAGGGFAWVMSETLQLNYLAIAEEATWNTFEFDEKSGYIADLAFKLHGVPACPGDVVNSASLQPPGDGAIDAADLAYLLSEWGANTDTFADLVTSETFQPPPDGFVDGADLAVLLGAWGACD